MTTEKYEKKRVFRGLIAKKEKKKVNLSHPTSQAPSTFHYHDIFPFSLCTLLPSQLSATWLLQTCDFT